MPASLLSIYTDSVVAQAWRASVKALGQTQGPALEEALQLWLQVHRKEINEALQPKAKLTSLPHPTPVKAMG